MINIEDIANDILKTEEFKTCLTEQVAIRVANEVIDYRYEELKTELYKALKEEYAKIANDFLTSYIEKHNIENLIKQNLSNLTKEEIIKFLTK